MHRLDVSMIHDFGKRLPSRSASGIPCVEYRIRDQPRRIFVPLPVFDGFFMGFGLNLPGSDFRHSLSRFFAVSHPGMMICDFLSGFRRMSVTRYPVAAVGRVRQTPAVSAATEERDQFDFFGESVIL